MKRLYSYNLSVKFEFDEEAEQKIMCYCRPSNDENGYKV
jgi:hypothetical protein